MTFHEFGKDNSRTLILIHPSAVMWDYFEYVIPLLEKDYHIIVPALPGYDEKDNGDFTSVEKIASDLAERLIERGLDDIECMYGCSMGGSIVIRFICDRKVRVRNAVIDGGITPYQLPWIVTRLIAVKDFLLIYLGKIGGAKLLEKAFATDDYSREDLRYVERVLDHMSAKTIWRTFESCNNYSMPDSIQTDCQKIEYWYAQAEAGERKSDIKYMRDRIPGVVFRKFDDLGHGGLAAKKPELFASEIDRVVNEGK